MHIMEITVQIS